MFKFEISEYIYRENLKKSMFDIFFFKREDTFREHKQYDLKSREYALREVINKKNEKITNSIYKERLKKSKELLVRAIRFNEIIDQEGYERQINLEKELEYFFKLRVDLFDSMSEFDIQHQSEFQHEERVHEWYNYSYFNDFRYEYFFNNTNLNNYNEALAQDNYLQEWFKKKGIKKKGQDSKELNLVRFGDQASEYNDIRRVT